MNKKIIVSIICILLVISISLVIVVNNSYSNKTVLSDGKVNTEKNNTSNMLTMMYETEADSGEYQIASDTNWLSGDYVFNETLSRCENGSDLRWDDTTNRVIIEATTADKCYVYFDIFVPELKYAYLVDANSVPPYFTGDIGSTISDEIVLLIDSVIGEDISLDANTITKNSISSNYNYVLNYGYNSAVHIKNSNIDFSAGTIQAIGDNALSLYIEDSSVLMRYIQIIQNNGIPSIIIDNSTIECETLILNNNLIYIRNTSALTFNSDTVSNMEIASGANVNIDNQSSLEGIISVGNNSNLTFINYGSFSGSISYDWRQSETIVNFENKSMLNLTGDLYVTVFNDNTGYSGINSNGYNIYYDRNSNPQLDGSVISLNGGGSLLPFN